MMNIEVSSKWLGYFYYLSCCKLQQETKVSNSCLLDVHSLIWTWKLCWWTALWCCLSWRLPFDQHSWQIKEQLGDCFWFSWVNFVQLEVLCISVPFHLLTIGKATSIWTRSTIIGNSLREKLDQLLLATPWGRTHLNICNADRVLL